MSPSAPPPLHLDGGIQFVYLGPEIIPELWPFCLHRRGQEAVFDGEHFRVESEALDLPISKTIYYGGGGRWNPRPKHVSPTGSRP